MGEKLFPNEKPDPVTIQATEEVCPTCFMVKPKNGECCE